jgi:dsRNA-specific ribonuclease/ERCC4-related helicase
LSEQQFRVLQQYLSAYHVRSLTGADDVDKWTTKELWNAFLAGVHVVVGTPAVLADALTHGFVPMARLSILVFDEGHRCVKNGPMNKIMRDFYHPAKQKGESIPHILALSASPVMHSGDLSVIESNLDATTVTPIQYRDDLEAHVHTPKLIKVEYGESDLNQASPIYRALKLEMANYDFEQDPYILDLQDQCDSAADRKLLKVRETGKTSCTEQLKSLHNRAKHIDEQLGGCLADWYISTCVSRYLERRENGTSVVVDLEAKERRHLECIITRIVSNTDNAGATVPTAHDASAKAMALLKVLRGSVNTGLQSILFVEQRAMVIALAYFLSCSDLSEEYKIGTFIGTSSFANRSSSLVDLFDAKRQDQDLRDFRDGSKNLMIATNVLEEGIDIPACGCVICFDLPNNLISFVQRRGRARQADSQYMLFVNRNDLQTDPSKWEELERRMIEAYMDEQRAAKDTSGIADLEENEASHIKYTIESTAALLTADNARGHLHHFCAVATRQTSRYIDPRPEFSAVQEPIRKTWTAYVALPSFLHKSVRTAQSSRPWKGEQAAIKEAAFNAYVALHKAGLVNDNLLPVRTSPAPEPGQQHADQPSLVQASEQCSLWDCHQSFDVQAGAQWHASRLVISLSGREVLSEILWLPFQINAAERIQLHWNSDVRYEASIIPMPYASLDAEGVSNASGWTLLLLRSVFASSIPSGRGDPALLLSPPATGAWSDFSGAYAGTDLVNHCQRRLNGLTSYGIVHVTSQHGKAYILKDIHQPAYDSQDPSQGDPELQLIVSSFPKRRTFLHAPDNIRSGTAYTSKQSFPISQCTIDRLPLDYSILAAFLPSMLHQIDTSGVAHQLNATILRPVQIHNVTTLLEAISAPAAGSPAGDYNRLEYLGDSILKFCTEFQIVAQHLTYPEAFLSAEKDRIVCNSNLAKASLEAGLDRFILTRQFTGKKWRPPYLDEMNANPKASNVHREISSKVLADVVEALIGAAYVDGGLTRAYTCIQTLLPKEAWWDSDTLFDTVLAETASMDPAHLASLEELIGHQFVHPALLLEAITHASQPNNRTSLSYERLEFFGDAVLDLIVTPKLHAHARKLRHWDLHRVHEALVNGYFLGYCCMALSGQEEIYDVVNTSNTKSPQMEARASTRTYHLYDFIRAGGQLFKAKQESLSRFEILSDPIANALQTSDVYPWPDLAALAPEKFFSDVVEAIAGAIYLDTRGDLSACEAFLEKLGILPTLRSILDREMETCFPKERVGILADREEVKYVVQHTDGEVVTWECVVIVGQNEVAKAGNCATREEAEVRAADFAAHALAMATGDGRRTRRKLNVSKSGQSEDQSIQGADESES